MSTETEPSRVPAVTGEDLPDLEVVKRVAVEIAMAAQEIQAVSARVSSVLSQGLLTSTVLRSPRTGLKAQSSLLQTVTNGRGLGYALTGTVEKLGGLTGQESLARLVAVTSLRLRIEAVARLHPELAEDETLRHLITAVRSDKDLETVRALRRLIKSRGIQKALTNIAPIFTELLAIRALLDENPLNDESGWSIATGRPVHEETLFGVTERMVCSWDVGDGHATRCDLDKETVAGLGTEISVTTLMRNIALVGNTGRILIQEIEGTRYVISAPGMQVGLPRNDSPQDLVGAWRNTLMNESPYTRSVAKAIEDFGIPDGAEILFMGHSEGGAVVMNIAQDPAFNRRFKITHVISVGAPVDLKTPPSDSFVATITNQHDLIPSLDGQGPGSPFHLHPDWYVVDYVGTHDFPACHNAWRYLEDLEYNLPEARKHIDENLTAYRGGITRMQAYRLWDKVQEPDGFPFLTVATAPRTTTGGTVELPLRSYDGSSALAYFAADQAAVLKLLEGTGLRPAVMPWAGAIVGLLSRTHRESSIGPFAEVGLAILVHDPWQPRPILVWADLMKRPHHRRSGAHVIDVAVSSDTAEVSGREIWGHRTFTTEIDFQLGKGRLAVAVPDLLELSGKLGPWVPGPEADLVLYSQREGETLRSLVDVKGSTRLHPSHQVRLSVGSSPNPMAGRLRDLGLAGARPFMVLSVPRQQTRLGAGVPVSVRKGG
ncbi:hypothetical protein [Rhizohabitans arisaemae]|uniref:hypothetical protein n=1 Tax=Rhizohabitans arisaemae TaxID=2720610 RepID=UPI0024B04E31|nr:hypothetical protein [Rhizohabitans arisaemae]